MSNSSSIQSETAPDYAAGSKASTDDNVIARALKILETRLKCPTSNPFTTAPDVHNFLTLQLAGEDREIFACMFLSNQNCLIAYEKLFIGTLDGASVYPREVLKRVLHHNAAAVIFAHNHPSGLASPSQADKDITQRLKAGLNLFDVKVLDHIIIGHLSYYSFTAKGGL